jgi:acetate kinase
MENIEQFLHQLPLFKTFTPADLRKLIALSHRESYASGETIIHFGQAGRFLGILLRGEARAEATTPDGQRLAIGRLGPGAFLGEISLLTGEPTSADVVAVEDCELLCIPQETFSTYLAVNPNALQVMARAITERLRWREADSLAQARVEDAWRSAPDPYGLQLSTPVPMKILVLNCGSSSLKYAYYDTGDDSSNREGIVERIGLPDARLVASSGQGREIRELGTIDHAQALQSVLALLTDPATGVLRHLGELNAVGHRVVHGGDRYSSAVLIDDQVLEQIEANAVLAPLHNPLNLMAIRESMRQIPGVPQVAVFDTGFHQKMPPQAYLYALPYELYERDHIRRYGFHGISHNYVALQAAAYLKRGFRELKTISCHLGNGASMCAIDHGRSVDTTMGLTPLEGLIMGTRSGDLDPSIVFYLLRQSGLSIAKVEDLLNRQSGLKGLSGVSSDFREVEAAANQGNSQALTAILAFCYRIRKYIGAYIAALGGLDVLVFTGGIGEGSAWVRSLACQGLASMGIQIDDLRNQAASTADRQTLDISADRSQVKVLVIPTDEERMIARETIRAISYQGVAQVIEGQQRAIPIEVSAHHVHLGQQSLAALFGPGHELTVRAELSQPGQYACEEIVTLMGPRGQVERVRVLGPLRSQTQVEIAVTEGFQLGVQAPIRASGDLDGSPGVTLVGPAGQCELSQGVICALRHIHMSPEEALSFGLKDRDVCMIRVEGERGLIFGDVLVRVHPDFRLSMHLDTDEANAAHIRTGMQGYLAGIQDRR